MEANGGAWRAKSVSRLAVLRIRGGPRQLKISTVRLFDFLFDHGRGEIFVCARVTLHSQMTSV